MNVVNIFVAVICLLVLQSDLLGDSVEFPGGITLLSGFEHQRGKGEDTLVGRIWKQGGIEIRYDIGVQAGTRVSNIDPKDRRWIQKQWVNGRPIVLVLTNDSQLIVTFCETDQFAPANFYGRISSSDELAEAILIILTYRDSKATDQVGDEINNKTPLEPIRAAFSSQEGLTIKCVLDSKGKLLIWRVRNGNQDPLPRERLLTAGQRTRLALLFADWHTYAHQYAGTEVQRPIAQVSYGGIMVRMSADGNAPPEARQAVAELLELTNE